MLVPAACMGLPPGQSFLSRWKNPDNTFKYVDLCPSKTGMAITYEPDCKLVTSLMKDLFRLDAARPTKEGYETDLLRNDGRALAFFFSSSSFYSDLGMFVWTNFWAKDYNFASISKILHSTDRAGIQARADQKYTV